MAYGAGLCMQAALGVRGITVGVILCGLALLRFRQNGVRLVPGWIPALVGAAALGALHGQQSDLAPALFPQTVDVEGWIASRPETQGRGEAAWFRVERARTDSVGPMQPRQAQVLLRARGMLPAYGKRCHARGTLRPGRAPRNFHAFDERDVLAAHAAGAVFDALQVTPLAGTGGSAWRRDCIEPLRTVLLQRIESTLAAPEREILAALVLGIDDDIEPAVQETWRGLGMAHVLAISGMHVSLVVTALIAVAGTVRRRRGLLALTCGVSVYAALGGLAPSVLRATVMAVWAALASHLGRPLRGLGALALAGATLVVGAPSLRHDLGFQLSCASTLGIVLWSGPLQNLGRRIRQERGWGRIAAFVATSVGLGLAAQLATLPLVFARFGYFSRAAPLADLALVPLANTALVVGLAGTPLALLSASWARPLWLVAGALLHAANTMGKAVLDVGDPRWFVPTLPAMRLLSGLVCAAGLLAGMAAGRRRLRVCVASLSVMAISAAILWVVAQNPRPPAWRLEALDVGQGDAWLLARGSCAWLIDAGDARPVDRGQHVVLPHLRRRGIRRLRGLVLTHPHLDHCGGAASVLRGIAVDTLYVAAISGTDPTYAAARAEGTPVRSLRAGSELHLGDDYAARVLWPPDVDVLGSGANGQSLVLWARGGGMPEVLAMGDLEADGEAALLAASSDIWNAVAAGFLVLKAGHHGSRTSSTAAFLDAIDAEIALVSVGERNRYGHPASETLAAFAARQCPVLRTDQGGAIRLDLRGTTLWMERPALRPAPLRSPPIAGETATPAPD